ncbi:hypothetical protein AVEN_226238-1 [Araneus ventricosus]|uniref:Uncharacterized protein n=1 Tax=Araneus ventricosus TaxID=182803 RepID=A0A4Y2P0V1_ARAVE|nr:hypothetical protein AVEN_226238-1 [Araneus ventricosus]
MGISVLSWEFTTTQHYSIWTNDNFVFHPFKSIDLGGSFKDAPKRTTSCFYPPTPPSARLTVTHPPHTGDFRFLRTTNPCRHAVSSNYYPMSTADMNGALIYRRISTIFSGDRHDDPRVFTQIDSDVALATARQSFLGERDRRPHSQ